MSISVVEPVVPAIATTKRMLFQNFDSKKFVKWLNVGFCAFVSQLEIVVLQSLMLLGQVVYFVFVISLASQPPAQTQKWFAENWPTLVAVAAGAWAVAYVVYLALIWAGSRGHFMFLDAVVQDRAAIREGWKEFATAGRSLFRFRLGLSLASLALEVGCVGLGLLVALPDIRAGRFASAAFAGIYSGVGVFILVSLAVSLVDMFLIHFVVPIMYQRRIGVLAGWAEFRRSFLAGRIGTFVVYILFQIALQMAIQALVSVIVCLTCNTAYLPYIGTHVLLLPFHVFTRAYSVSFLEQFGSPWHFFPALSVIPVGRPTPAALRQDERIYRAGGPELQS